MNIGKFCPLSLSLFSLVRNSSIYLSCWVHLRCMFSPIITRRQKGGFVKGWFWHMCPRSGFFSGGTCKCTLVPVFVPGEHANVPSFWSFRGNICQNHPLGKPPFREPPTLVVNSQFTFKVNSSPRLFLHNKNAFQTIFRLPGKSGILFFDLISRIQS